jgi:hypothetical protein
MLMASWKNYDKGAFGLTRFLHANWNHPGTSPAQAFL